MRRGAVMALGVALLALSPAVAQEYRGNLYIQVMAGEEEVAVGATVELTGETISRAGVTDSEGKTRFIKLEPGAYQVTVKLAGYNTVVQKDVTVDTLTNTTITIKLERSEMVEEVVVTAETPLLDERKVGTSTVLTQAEISEVPTARDPWAVLSTIPGVTTDRVNVGGNESGQQSNFVGKGDDGDNTTWNMDGVDFTDLGAIGATSSYLDFNAFEQIGFVTGGADVEQMTPGLSMNFVTRQGSNRTTGDARLWYANQNTQADNVKGLTQPPNVGGESFEGNKINEVFEKNFDIGGPIWRDHIWYWFGFTQNDVDIQVITGASDKTKLRNTSFKLHGQIAGKSTWKLFYTDGDKIKDGRGAAVTRPPETTWDQEGPTPIYTAYFSHFFTPNFELSVQYGHVDGKFSLTPKGDLNDQIFLDEDGVWHNTFFYYDTVRPQDQYTIKGNNFFGGGGGWEHELKYGFRYKTAEVESISKASNQDVFGSKVNVLDGYPPYVYIYREVNLQSNQKYYNAWIGDTMLKGNWAINAGLHFSRQEGSNAPRNVAANFLCPTCVPAIDFAGNDAGGFDWTDVSPRLGFTYTFATDKKLLLRANYAHYVDNLGSLDIVYANPAQFYTYMVLEWDDVNDDDLVQTSEIVGGNDPCANYLWANNIDPCDPTAVGNNKIDPDYKAPRVDELVVGVEYALAPDFTFAANVTYRQKDQLRWFEGRKELVAGPLYDVNVFNSSGQLVPIPSSAFDCSGSASGTIEPDGTPYEVTVCDLVDMSATTSALPRYYTNRPGYDQEFWGVELIATKRLSKKWMFRGYVSWNDWTQSYNGTSGIQDPNNYQGGTADNGGAVSVPSTGSGTKDGIWLGTSRWQINVNGLYQLPYGMTVSANLYGREGYGIPYYDVASIYSGSTRLQVGSIESIRYNDLWDFDFKFAKLFKIESSTNVELSAEVFNLFNENTILGVDPRASTPSRTNTILEILSPRIIRFGATVTF